MLSFTWFLFVAITLACAIVDLATYRIPNVFVLVLLGVFLIVAAIHFREVAWLEHLGAGLLVLVCGLFLYSIRQMGAGDVKLLSALAVWSGIYPLVPLLFWVSVCGFVAMLAIVLLRHLVPRLQRGGVVPKDWQAPKILKKGQGVPFGLGIGPGAIIASFYFPHWLWQI